MVRIPVRGVFANQFLHIFSVVFRQLHLFELTLSGFIISRVLAVANLANINSNEAYCRVCTSYRPMSAAVIIAGLEIFVIVVSDLYTLFTKSIRQH